MADQRRRLSELPVATNLQGLVTLGVDNNNEGVKILLDDIINESVNSIQRSIGSPNGLAPLDENGKIPAEYFTGDGASAGDEQRCPVEVVELAVIVAGVNIRAQSFNGEPDGVDAVLVYDSVQNAILLRHTTREGSIATNSYYNNWLNSDSVSELAEGLRRPVRDKLYVCPASGKIFYYHNGGLSLLAAGNSAPEPAEEYEFMTDEEIDALFDEHADAPAIPLQIPLTEQEIEEILQTGYVAESPAEPETVDMQEDAYEALTDGEIEAICATKEIQE